MRKGFEIILGVYCPSSFLLFRPEHEVSGDNRDSSTISTVFPNPVDSKLAPLYLFGFLQALECVETAGRNTGNHLGTFMELEMLFAKLLLQLV